MRLGERLKIERELGIKLTPIFESKGWRRNKYNNTFEKDDIVAYLYNTAIVFHFKIGSNNFVKTHHKIRL